MNVNDKRKMVQFTTNCSPYLAGERAAFPLHAASRLIDRKVAIYVTKDEKAEGAVSEEAPVKEKANANDEPNAGDRKARGKAESGTGDDGAEKPGKKRRGKGKTGKRGKRVRTDGGE